MKKIVKKFTSNLLIAIFSLSSCTNLLDNSQTDSSTSSEKNSSAKEISSIVESSIVEESSQSEISSSTEISSEEIHEEVFEGTIGLQYEIFENADEYKVSVGECSSCSEIVIPKKYNGLNVTSIDYAAFRDCTSLKSITIPNSVTSIENSAFENCTSLESIIFPDGVTDIGSYVFRGCTSLKSVSIPDTIINVDREAFWECNLNYNEYENGFYLGNENNKYTCLCHRRVNGDYKYEIHPDTKYIMDYCFQDCNQESLSIPDGVNAMGEGVFEHCYSMYNEYENAYYIGNEDNPYLWLVQAKDTDIKECVVNSNTKHIATGAFVRCESLELIDIKNGVVSIGRNAFMDCTSLKSITIPDSVELIGSNVFYDCQIENATIPAIAVCSVNSKYLKNVVITSGKQIGRKGHGKTDRISNLDGFAFCSSLVSVVLPNTITEIGDFTFYGCKSLESITIPSSVTRIGIGAFEYCSSLKSIIIPEGVTSIERDTFFECTSLETISIPNSITTLEEYFIYHCNALKYNTYDNGLYLGNDKNEYLILVGPANEEITSFVINSNTKHIASDAFESCSNLETLTIPEGVLTIGDYAFSFCSIKVLEIPSSVNYLGYMAFCGCPFTSITVSKDNKTFDSRDNCNAIIRTATNEIVNGCENTVIPESVTAIGGYSFVNIQSFKNFNIPNHIKSIGEAAFGYCTALETIIIPDGISSLNEATFYYCVSLKSIVIPNSVKFLGAGLFEDCSSLTDIYFTGTEEEWNAISMDEDFEIPSNVKINYNYVIK